MSKVFLQDVFQTCPIFIIEINQSEVARSRKYFTAHDACEISSAPNIFMSVWDSFNSVAYAKQLNQIQ